MWRALLILFLLLPRLLFIADVLEDHCCGHSTRSTSEPGIPWNEHWQQFKHKAAKHLPTLAEEQNTQFPQSTQDIPLTYSAHTPHTEYALIFTVLRI